MKTKLQEDNLEESKSEVKQEEQDDIASEVKLFKRSSTLYAKKEDPSATLDDFEIIRILG